MEEKNEKFITLDEAKEAIQVFVQKYDDLDEQTQQRQNASDVLESYVKQSYQLKEPLGVGIWSVCDDKRPETNETQFIKLGDKYCGTLIRDENDVEYKTCQELYEKCSNQDLLMVTHNTIRTARSVQSKSYALFVDELQLMVLYAYELVQSEYRLEKSLRMGFCFKKQNGYFVFEGNHIFNGMFDGASVNILKQFIGISANIVHGLRGHGDFTIVPLDTPSNFFTAVVVLNKEKYASQNRKGLTEKWKLKDLDVADMKNGLEESGVIKKAIVEKTEKGFCVIRCCYQYQDQVNEYLRMYLSKKKEYVFYKDNQNRWIEYALNNTMRNKYEIYHAPVGSNDVSGTIFQGLINDDGVQMSLGVLLLALKYERIEQLLKSKMRGFILERLSDTNNCAFWLDSEQDLSDCLDSAIRPNKAEKSLNRWLGLNRHQIEKIAEICAIPGLNNAKLRVVRDMKGIFVKSHDISSVDNKTFDNVCDCWLQEVSNRGMWGADWMSAVGEILENDFNEKAASHYRSTYLNTIVEMDASDIRGSYGYSYRDYLEMVVKLEMQDVFNLYPKDKEELMALHDQVARLYNLKKDEYELKEFKKQVKKVEKLEYNKKDSNFVVKIPTKPEDLAIEGTTLNHCVKTYIDRVIKGSTNIVFIRKKDEEEKPFFTVEVDNRWNIVQAHGFSNSNVSTVHGLKEFIDSWAEEKELTVGNINIVR